MAKIVNIMLGRNLGGIEQSFLDYSASLKIHNYDVINIVSIYAKIPHDDSTYKLLNLGTWDYLSVLHLKIILLKYKPDIIIAHGNRAISFALKAKIENVKIIGVAHNYNIKHITKCDYIFVITNHLRNYLATKNVSDYKMKLIPNSIKLSSPPNINYSGGLYKIGAMGRFVKKKGFDHFLYSLSLLKSKSVKFKAVIAGDGEEKEHLIQLRNKLKLTNDVEFMGWIYNKEDFFSDIDIFCLPSIHEPFGIILLEAMKYGKVIVSTASEGPNEIITDGKNGVLVPVSDDISMANCFEYLITHREAATTIAENAYLSVEKNYDIKVVSNILHNHLGQILNDIRMHKIR